MEKHGKEVEKLKTKTEAAEPMTKEESRNQYNR